jgi:hypothetical protein
MQRRCLVELPAAFSSLAVIADSFDGAGREGFVAQLSLFSGRRLLIDERIAVIVRACEIIRRGIPANVAVYAL